VFSPNLYVGAQFKILFFSLSLWILFFQTAIKLLGRTVIKLFGPTYWVKESVMCLSWPRGAVKKKFRDTKESMNRESLGTAVGLFNDVQSAAKFTQKKSVSKKTLYSKLWGSGEEPLVTCFKIIRF